HRQEVHRRADVLLREGALVVVARRAGALRVDTYDVEMEGMHVARIPRDGVDPVELNYGLVVGGKVRLADLTMPLQLVELRERDRGEHVGQVGLVPGHR